MSSTAHGRRSVSVAISIVLACTVVGCSKSEGDRPLPRPATATDVLGRLLVGGEPVGRFGDQRGGVNRPAVADGSSPTSSLTFLDNRFSKGYRGRPKPELGGSIEFYPTEEAARQRAYYLKNESSVDEHILVESRAVVRLSPLMTPSQVAAYQRALNRGFAKK